MRRYVIREGDTTNTLSAVCSLPACMLLRANGLFAPSWLLPGREIRVPEADYCLRVPGTVCPYRALHLPAWPGGLRKLPCLPPETAGYAAVLNGLPRRLLLLARGRGLYVPADLYTATVRYGETWPAFLRRCPAEREEVQRINRYWGELLPGMRLALPIHTNLN